MVLKKENSIYIAINTWGVDDDRLITAIFGYLPDKETIKINGSENLLYSKTKVFNDNYYSIYDGIARLNKIDNDLDFTVTNYGDIVIYRTNSTSCTPQEVMDSYNRYISSRFFIRKKNKEDKKMGTILHEGEYILISHKITNETGYMGHSVLARIGINTSKVNFLGSTRHFLTFAVIKDLELPFNTTEWQDLKINNVRFHAYTHSLKNLILLEHDEFSLDYTDEVHDFFEKKKKEKENMEKFNCVKSNSGRYDPLRVTMPRGNGKSASISMLNSIYGLNGGISIKKPPLKFKLIFGIEHATGRYKTICLWEDGEKTIIHGDNKVTKLPVAQAFAWCYVKRTFRTVSHFKKHVDKRTTKMDGVWYFEGDCLMDEYAQGSVPGTSKKRDIYDAAALAIVTKRYGGLRKLVDEYINKEDENGTR